jgi:hypothetical protein
MGAERGSGTDPDAISVYTDAGTDLEAAVPSRSIMTSSVPIAASRLNLSWMHAQGTPSKIETQVGSATVVQGLVNLKAEALQFADEGVFELLDVTVIEIICS